MLKYILLFVCFAAVQVSGQVVSRVHLLDHRTYYTNLINEAMNEVERRGWCNLTLPDIPKPIDLHIYGWDVVGNVTYKNGFVHSIQHMDLLESSVNQVFGHTTSTGLSQVTVRGTLRLHDVALGFDVEVALENEPVQHFTGVYTHILIEYATTIRKILQTDELSTTATLNSLSAGNVRMMMYMPDTPLTEVLQRQYTPSDAFNAINAWGTQIIAPIILEKATSVVPFPEMCYNCAL